MKNVKELFSNSEFSFNEMATKRAFLNQLPQHSIVHVYSHAEADPLGNEHKIYFSDSILLVSELQALGKLPTRLILLTACNTGVGKVFQGEGIFSMARAFASSGVPASISTLWAIEDQSIYQITELFYQFLKDGLPLDVAQQQAKLAFLQRNEASLSLPYYWAGSVLIGNSKSFFKEKSDIAIYASLILFFLILASSFYFLRKRLN